MDGGIGGGCVVGGCGRDTKAAADGSGRLYCSAAPREQQRLLSNRRAAPPPLLLLFFASFSRPFHLNDRLLVDTAASGSWHSLFGSRGRCAFRLLCLESGSAAGRGGFRFGGGGCVVPSSLVPLSMLLRLPWRIERNKRDATSWVMFVALVLVALSGSVVAKSDGRQYREWMQQRGARLDTRLVLAANPDGSPALYALDDIPVRCHLKQASGKASRPIRSCWLHD